MRHGPVLRNLTVEIVVGQAPTTQLHKVYRGICCGSLVIAIPSSPERSHDALRCSQDAAFGNGPGGVDLSGLCISVRLCHGGRLTGGDHIMDLAQHETSHQKIQRTLVMNEGQLGAGNLQHRGGIEQDCQRTAEIEP